jgi:NCAIR mutase (PurE)-related protein
MRDVRRRRSGRRHAGGEPVLGFAHVDSDRARRRGFPEVVFCPGKTTGQLVAIMRALMRSRQDVLATRATPAQYEAVAREIPAAVYHEAARAITVDSGPRRRPAGLVAVVCAGTSDIPVAEEAALTAERMGARVSRVRDVGVAGLHRLIRHLRTLRAARAVVVAAGMEGALPSVVAGLVPGPVIAVPTSVGYGVSLGGVAALLAMLNSCVPGVTVVNIDNGFGAGAAAAMINAVPRRRGAGGGAR